MKSCGSILFELQYEDFATGIDRSFFQTSLLLCHKIVWLFVLNLTFYAHAKHWMNWLLSFYIAWVWWRVWFKHLDCECIGKLLIIVYFHCKNILKNKVYDKHFLILKFLSDILLRTFFILLFTHKLLGFVNILMSAPCSHLSLGVIRCSFPL